MMMDGAPAIAYGTGVDQGRRLVGDFTVDLGFYRKVLSKPVVAGMAMKVSTWLIVSLSHEREGKDVKL